MASASGREAWWPALLLTAAGAAAGFWFCLRPAAVPTGPASSHPVQEKSAPVALSENPGSSTGLPLARDVDPDPGAVSPLLKPRLRELLELQTGDVENAQRLTSELLTLLTPGNVAGIVPSLSREELDSTFGVGALRYWMNTDPGSALTWLGAQPETTDEQNWVVARKLAATPELLDQFDLQFPEGAWRESVLHHAGITLADQDHVQAIAVAGKMQAGAEQADVIGTTVHSWGHADPDATLQWILAMDDSSERDKFLAVAAKARAMKDPRAGASQLIATVKPSAAYTEAAMSIIDLWLEQEPREAAAWVSSLPEGELREAAVNTVYTQWMKSDRGAAVGWISTIPERARILEKLSAAPVRNDADVQD